MKQLGEVLGRAVRHIRSGVLRSEAMVRTAIIDPVLGALGWDATNPGEFHPEYPVDSGFVDYALMPFKKPLVFIEAKKLGTLSESFGVAKAEEQLFGYAAKKGIPLLVLTDGNIWDFYLSMAAGEPHDRRFCRIELDGAGDLAVHEGSFRKFLDKDKIASGRAKSEAEKLHHDLQRQTHAREALPEAWQSLRDPPDDLLVELLAEKAHSLCGVMPRHEDVGNFLRGLSVSSVAPAKAPLPTHKGQTTQQPVSQSKSPKESPSVGEAKTIGYQLYGREIIADTWIAALQAVLNDFQSRDKNFLERMYRDARNRRSRKGKVVLVAQQREEFVRPLRSKELDDGWWLNTSWDTKNICKKIELACEMAGVKFGTELTLTGQTAKPQSLPKPSRAAEKPVSTGKGKIIGYQLYGREVVADTGAATLQAVLDALQSRDKGFLQRLYQDPRNRRRTSALVSQQREELYSKEFQKSPNFDQKNMCRELDDGWWVGTKLNAADIRTKIMLACEVAGVKFGTELTLIEK